MFNKTFIIGRLGHTPQLKTTKTGIQVCTFPVAVDIVYSGKKATDWFNVSVFGKQAENSAKYLKKGALACVTGQIHMRMYEGRDGKEKSVLELTADSVTFLSSKSDSQPPEYENGELIQNDVVDDEVPF